ncbi:hypothetical protein D9M71_616100 [compost metagenome]
MADIQQRAYFAVDGGVLAGIIDAHLDDAEQRAQDERHQYGKTRLLEREAVGERYIHGDGASSRGGLKCRVA